MKPRPIFSLSDQDKDFGVGGFRKPVGMGNTNWRQNCTLPKVSGL